MNFYKVQTHTIIPLDLDDNDGMEEEEEEGLEDQPEEAFEIIAQGASL